MENFKILVKCIPRFTSAFPVKTYVCYGNTELCSILSTIEPNYQIIILT